MTLEERTTRLEDMQAIRNMAAELMYHADLSDADGMVEHMHPDIHYDARKFGACRGREATRAWIQELWKQIVWRQHHLSNQVIKFEDTKAYSKSYYQAMLIISGRAVVASGAYEDELEKIDGRWLITSRCTTVSYLSPLDEGWAKTRLMEMG